MSTEKLLYCDLCGTPMPTDGAKLAVPMKPEEIYAEQLQMLRQHPGSLAVRWYDVCDACVHPLLAHVRVHQAAAKRDVEARYRAQLIAQGREWLGLPRDIIP